MKLNLNTLFIKENKPAVEEIKEIQTPDDFRKKMNLLKNAGYFTLTAGSIFSSGIASAQDVDSLKNPEIFVSSAIEHLDTNRDYVVGKDSLPPSNIEIKSEVGDTLKFKTFDGILAL